MAIIGEGSPTEEEARLNFVTRESMNITLPDNPGCRISRDTKIISKDVKIIDDLVYLF